MPPIMSNRRRVNKKASRYCMPPFLSESRIRLSLMHCISPYGEAGAYTAELYETVLTYRLQSNQWM